MMTAETLLNIANACAPKGAVVREVARNGRKVWAVISGKVDVLVRESLKDVAITLEAEARRQPLVNEHEDTHLFGQKCTVTFAERRGEFYLDNGTTKAHLSWHGPGTRWVAYDVTTGARLKYGPRGDFKLAWSEKERAQPALKAWLAY